MFRLTHFVKVTGEYTDFAEGGRVAEHNDEHIVFIAVAAHGLPNKAGRRGAGSGGKCVVGYGVKAVAFDAHFVFLLVWLTGRKSQVLR